MGAAFSIKDIGQKIYFIRGHRVMLDSDLDELYGVETRVLNQAARRNSDRFPDDIAFQLNRAEFEFLMSQIVISKTDPRGGRQKLHLVFTEQGVAMLSGVLKSKSAVQVNVTIMRTFVKMREFLETNKELAKKLEEIEQKFTKHDEQFKIVFEALRQLMGTGIPVHKKIKGLIG